MITDYEQEERLELDELEQFRGATIVIGCIVTCAIILLIAVFR